MAKTVNEKNAGALVKKLRLAKGMTQFRLASLTGVAPLTIIKAETANVITWRTAKRLGDVFGVDPRDLVTVE